MRIQVLLVVLLACAGCGRAVTQPPKRVNIEVTGSAQCLGNIAADLGLSTATMPVFTNQVGRVEFGPVEATEFSKLVDQIRAAKCVQAIQQRPCATPLSDADTCNAPALRANGT